MKYLLLLITIVVMCLQNIVIKQYNAKAVKVNIFLFTAISSFFAMLFSVFSSGLQLTFVPEIVPYSVIYAILYTASVAGCNIALATGSLAITSLIVLYSLIIPTLHGILVLKEPLKMTTCVGIALLFISLFMINMKREEIKFSLKWVIAVLIGFIGNGTSTTSLKIQQIDFDGAYKNEFTVLGLGLACIALLVLSFITKEDRKRGLKDCCKYAPLAGIASGGSIILMLVLTALIPSVILYPSISAGGVILALVVSLFVYKEKLSKLQLIGYAIGTVSIVFLNI